jgi:hypothetical protein
VIGKWTIFRRPWWIRNQTVRTRNVAVGTQRLASLGELEERLLGFGERYEQVANPFEWKFTRRDLRRLLRKLRERERPLAAVA